MKIDKYCLYLDNRLLPVMTLNKTIFNALTVTGIRQMEKVFKNGLSEICGRQPLKNLKEYGLLKHCLKTVFHKFYLVYS